VRWCALCLVFTDKEKENAMVGPYEYKPQEENLPIWEQEYRDLIRRAREVRYYEPPPSTRSPLERPSLLEELAQDRLF